MAEEKGKPGLLAILGVGKEKGSEEESDEPSSRKARAVKAMFEACQAGDWDDAAREFGIAYDACMMGEDEEESESSDEDEDSY